MQLLSAIFGLAIFLIVLFAFLRIFRISDDVAAIRKLLEGRAAPAAVSSSSTPTRPRGRVCPNCKAPLADYAAECTKCGVTIVKAGT
jgi:hypothetical protein